MTFDAKSLNRGERRELTEALDRRVHKSLRPVAAALALLLTLFAVVNNFTLPAHALLPIALYDYSLALFCLIYAVFLHNRIAPKYANAVTAGVGVVTAWDTLLTQFLTRDSFYSVHLIFIVFAAAGLILSTRWLVVVLIGIIGPALVVNIVASSPTEALNNAIVLLVTGALATVIQWTQLTSYTKQERALRAAEREIRERQRAEEAQEQLKEQLRQAQQVESLGRLAGGVAHDFNNLLSPIIGYSEMALKRVSPDQLLYADLEQIKEAGYQAKDLTAQLLAFGRKQVLSVQVLDLNDLIAKARPMLRRLIREDIAIDVRPDQQIGKVKADRAQLHQILVNLVVNAEDALPDGGAVTIRTVDLDRNRHERAMLPEGAEGSYVMMAVQDDGTGMDDEVVRRIFEPFFTTKDVGHGTGMGLSTVYGIVMQHEGYVTVESELGQGTTFRVFLPKCDPTESSGHQAAKQDSAEVERAHETILVLEDEPKVRDLVVLMLSRSGYDVLQAADPDEAMSASKDHDGKIHLLLTDIVLPGKNGQEVYQQLHRFRPDLRVMYMSGYSDDVIAHHGVLFDGLQFLPKPFTAEELLAKVREALI